MKKRLLATIPVLLVVFLCSFNVYAYTNGNAYRYNSGDLLSNDLEAYINYYVSYPYKNSEDYDYNVDKEYYGSSTYPYPYLTNYSSTVAFCELYQVDVPITVNLKNGTASLYQSNNAFLRLNFNFTHVYTPECFYVTCDSDDFVLSEIGNGYIILRPVNPYLSYGGTLSLPAGTNSSVVVTYHFLYSYVSTSGGLGNATSGTSFNSNAKYTQVTNDSFTIQNPGSWTEKSSIIANFSDVINFNYLFTLIRSLTNSYDDVTNESQTIESGSNSLTTQSDNVHSQESSYYTQTNTALSNTGLSNYTFSSDVVGGMGIVKNQFTYVWNKLDNFNVVYTFSLTLSVALLIIRHVRPIRRKKEE